MSVRSGRSGNKSFEKTCSHLTFYLQETFHAIANAGTLLFELGDVGKQFFVKHDDSADSLVSAAAAYNTSSLIDNVSNSLEFFL